MNYVIGMCRDSEHWVKLLADWGYEVQIIEQKHHTSKDEVVKPDLIAASNSLLHALVFELKGGKSIDRDQIERYSNLLPSDLRWVTVYDRANLRMDVCICDFEADHFAIKLVNNVFAMLTFRDELLTKEGAFKLDKLNDLFKEPISLKGMLPPYSYYPFSDEDTLAYIAAHVIRTIVSILQKNIKMSKESGMDELRSLLISPSDVMATKFIYIWKFLSDEHRRALKGKIDEVIRKMFSDKDIVESLGVIQSKEGVRVTRNFEQFERFANNFLEGLISEKDQTSILDYPHGLNGKST
jgi:hypothetical protein